MTVPLTGTSGLFTRIGAFAGPFLQAEGWQKTNMPGWESNILPQFPSSVNDIPTISSDITSAVSSLDQVKNVFFGYASATLVDMVNTDILQPDSTAASALNELISQMTAASASLNANTVSSSVTASPVEVGASIIVGTINGLGQTMQYVYAEKISVTCTQDGQSTGNTGPGYQSFTASGEQSAPSLYSSSWPMGSGASASIQLMNPDANATSANLLTNSNFETWASSTLSSWTYAVGSTATIVQSSSPFRGSYALSFLGNGTELTQITQSVTQILPQTVYAISFRAKVSATAAGALSVGISGVGTVTVNASALTTTYAEYNVVFASPSRIITPYTFSVSLTAALTSGISLIIDDLVLAPMTQVGDGVYLAIPPAAAPFIAGDQFTVSVANSYAGQLQTWMWRAFGLDSLGVIIPNSASPTVSDSLITT